MNRTAIALTLDATEREFLFNVSSTDGERTLVTRITASGDKPYTLDRDEVHALTLMLRRASVFPSVAEQAGRLMDKIGAL